MKALNLWMPCLLLLGCGPQASEKKDISTASSPTETDTRSIEAARITDERVPSSAEPRGAPGEDGAADTLEPDEQPTIEPARQWAEPDVKATEATLGPLEERCKQGDGEACYSAGWSYYRGDGAPLDSVEGRRLIDLACDHKVAIACSFLGMHYHHYGTDPLHDREDAFRYYERACTLGEHKVACVNGATRLIKKATHPHALDPRIALWFQLACEAGEAFGCYNLGIAFERSRAFQDQAKQWFRRGCALGDPDSCSRGDRVPPDAERHEQSPDNTRIPSSIDGDEEPVKSSR